MGYHKDGKEYLDDTPVTVPAGFRKPPSIHDMIKSYIRSERFAEKMKEQGLETEEEANDFEVEEDEDVLITRHEFAAMAGDEAMQLTAQEKFEKMRGAYKGARKNGPSKDTAGDSGAGPVGKESKGGNRSESGSVAGDRKAAPGTVESEG